VTCNASLPAGAANGPPRSRSRQAVAVATPAPGIESRSSPDAVGQRKDALTNACGEERPELRQPGEIGIGKRGRNRGGTLRKR
jgi:hypothetical protein